VTTNATAETTIPQKPRVLLGLMTMELQKKEQTRSMSDMTKLNIEKKQLK